MTKRIQRRRTKGWRKPEGAVYVGRGTKWGNPWRVVKLIDGPWCIVEPDGHRINFPSREDAVRTAVSWFSEAIPNGWEGVPDYHEIRSELDGKDLMCFCPLDQPCHADVLLELANGGESK